MWCDNKIDADSYDAKPCDRVVSDVVAHSKVTPDTMIINAGASAAQEKYTRSEATSARTFRLPPGARLTGNKETDDDIIAFYKAKEALDARNNARKNALPAAAMIF